MHLKIFDKLSARRIVLICVVIFVFICAIFIASFAKDMDDSKKNYEVNSVSVTGQIETDGCLSVVDQKTIRVNEGAKVISERLYRPTDVGSISVENVRLISKEASDDVDAKVVSLIKQQRTCALDKNNFKKKLEALEQTSSFSYDESGGNLYISLPENFDYSKDYVVEATYIVKNSLFVYDDVAELYWDYLPATNENLFQSIFADAKEVEVKATLMFPIPEGQVANFNDNVFAWGHGGAGYLEFLEDGALEITSALNSTSVTSRVHLVLPKAFLSNVSNNSPIKKGGARKNYAIQEEKTWNDSSNIKLSNEFKVTAITCGVAGIVLAICSSLYALQLFRFKRLAGGREEGAVASDFDKRAIKRQKRYLIISIVMVLLAFANLLMFENNVSLLAFLATGGVILLFSNWTPTFASTYRDKL